MSKRQRLEKIIIGTLLDIRDHYDDVRGYVTEDMFSDSTCRRIYGLIVQMRNEGAEHTDPNSIFKRYGEAVADIIPQMVQLCSEYSFEWMKVRYNEKQFIGSLYFCTACQVTDIEFIDYVKHFINLVIEDEKRNNRTAADFAA